MRKQFDNRKDILMTQCMKGASFEEQLIEVLDSSWMGYSYLMNEREKVAYLTGEKTLPRDIGHLGVYGEDEYHIYDFILPDGSRMPLSLKKEGVCLRNMIINPIGQKDAFPLLQEKCLKAETKCCLITSGIEMAFENTLTWYDENIVWLGVYPVNGSVEHHDFSSLRNQENVIFILEKRQNFEGLLRSFQTAENILSKLENLGVKKPLCIDPEKSEIYNLEELQTEKKLIEEF